MSRTGNKFHGKFAVPNIRKSLQSLLFTWDRKNELILAPSSTAQFIGVDISLATSVQHASR